MPYLLGRYNWLAYGVFNVSVWVAITLGAAIGGGSLANFPYVILLFAVCTTPIPLIGRLNGAYALLSVAMAHYFVEFALLDLVSMLSPLRNDASHQSLLSPGEVVILIGAALKIIGFHIALRFAIGQRAQIVPKDWPRKVLLPIGMLLWAAGTALTVYQALFLLADNTNRSVAIAYGKLGAVGTDAFIFITSYAGPLGIIVLSYWWAVWKRRGSTPLMLFLVAAQFVAGWIVDTKEVAISAPFIMILTRFIAVGKVPARWVVGALIGIVLVFPVLTAKRIIVTEGLHLSRLEALARAPEILAQAIAERDVARKGTKYDQKSQSFLERLTDKGAVDVFVARVGVDMPYKNGATLDQLLYAFVPRIIWSNKPGENSAQTFNRDFHLSEDPDTHISPTHIGELYWNFGYPGVVVGMTLFGLLLGYVFGRFDPSAEPSITRVLVIIVTLYETVIGGGGQIELAYVVWVRTLALIWLLHAFLARPRTSKRDDGSGVSDVERSRATRAQRPTFDNLLR